MNPRQCLLLLLLVFGLAACPANNTPQPSPPSPAPASGYEPPGGDDHPPVTQDARDAGAAPVVSVDAAAPVVATGPQADGAPCLSESDCTSGVCEGLGCGADLPGTCMPRSRRCTRDRRAYCGCDGKTFFASGTCPGKRHSARQMCPDGQ